MDILFNISVVNYYYTKYDSQKKNEHVTKMLFYFKTIHNLFNVEGYTCVLTFS